MNHCGNEKKLKKPISFTIRAWIYRSLLTLSIGLLLGFSGVYPQSKRIIGKSNLAKDVAGQVAPIARDDGLLPKEIKQIKSIEKNEVLSDPLGRIGSDFKVPKRLKRRTTFWFNIYTKFGQYEHVIHHTRYPWIIYKVIDGRSIVENKKGPRWLRVQKVNNLAKAERKKIRKALSRLARKRKPKKLTKLERRLVKILKRLPGKRRNVYEYAAKSLRSQLGQKDFFIAGLKRSSKYLPLMEDEFRKMNLPLELTRMPFVESSFNELAESKVGASGIWQIMPATGRAYSIVNKYIDERNSPLKATLTAGKVLTRYKRSLKKWPLVVTSYNHGIGNIRKAIKAARSKNIATIIDRYHHGAFKFASSNFYTSFLAALHAEKYQNILFKKVVKDPLLDFVEIHLDQRIRVKTLMKYSGLKKGELLIYNRDLKKAVRKNARLPRGYRLHLPPDRADRLIKKISKRVKIKSRSIKEACKQPKQKGVCTASLNSDIYIFKKFGS